MSLSYTETIAGRFLDAGGFGINVRHPEVGAAGDGVADDGPVFNGLAEGHYLVPAGTYRIATTASVPRHAYLVVARGAVFEIDAGARLRLHGGVEAGPYRIFSGDGVVFGPGVNNGVLPQWWGAAGDGSRDDTEAIQSAIRAHDLVRFPNGSYAIGETIVLGTSQYLVGEARGRTNAGGPTIFVHPASQAAWPDGQPMVALSPGGGDVSECGVSGLRFQGWTDYYRDRQANAGPVAIDCQKAKNSCVIEDVGVEKCRTGLVNRPAGRWVVTLRNVQITKCAEALDWTCNNGKMYDVSCRQNRSSGRIMGGQNALYGCHFENESALSTLRLSGQVLLSGCWLEANLHHFETDDHLNLTVVSSHFGATTRSGQPSYEHGMALLDGRDVRIIVAGSYIRSSRMGWVYRVSPRAENVRVKHVNVEYDDVINRFYWNGSRAFQRGEPPPPVVSHFEMRP